MRDPLPPHSVETLPLSLMAQSAWLRVCGVVGLLVVLWLAIWWAVMKP